MSGMSSVFIATPCFGGMVTQAYMQSIISLIHQTMQPPIQFTLALLGNDALITRSRNTLVSTFLNDTNATHLLFIDADISFDPQQIVRLMAADKDVVAGMYPIKALDWGALKDGTEKSPETCERQAMHYVGTPLDEREQRWDGDFVTASYAGTGMILIKRVVIERMIVAYPELRYSAIHAYPRTKQTPATQYALFECMIDPETGLYLSEDFAFCQRWRNLGGEIWVDTASQLTHTGPYAFSGDPCLRYAAQRKVPLEAV